MATSGTFEVFAVSPWLRVQLVWALKSQSVENNTSTVNFQVRLLTVGGNITSAVNKDITLNVNGTKYTGEANVTIGKNTTKLLMEKTLTINHDTDGTKSISVSASVAFNIALITTGNWLGTKSVSGTITLPEIDRVSTFTRSGTAEMGSAQAITITRANSNFTHTLKYTFAGTTATIATGIGTSHKWTPPVSLAAKIPNATSGSCKLTLETYSGSVLLGSTTLTFNLGVPASVVPTVSALTLTETAEEIIGLMTGLFVNTKSKIRYKVAAAGAQGSTIKAYKVSIAGQTFATATATTAAISPGAGTKTATVTVTDSRGRTATKSVEYEVLPYTPPTFYSIEVNRCIYDDETDTYVLDENGESLALDMELYISDLEGFNAFIYRLEYKRTTDDDYTRLTFSHDGYSFKGVHIIKDVPFSINSTYSIRFTATDAFHSIPKELSVSTARPVFDMLYSGSGFAFNKMAEEPGVLDIGYKTRFFGGILPLVIPEGADLNELTLPGFYVSVNQDAENYVNCPLTGGTFSLEVLGAGAEGQLLHRLIYTSKTTPKVYIRHYYGSEWGPWFLTFQGGDE